jgi:hypothetical protein
MSVCRMFLVELTIKFVLRGTRWSGFHPHEIHWETFPASTRPEPMETTEPPVQWIAVYFFQGQRRLKAKIVTLIHKGLDSSVSIVNRLRAGRPWFFPRKGQRMFLFTTAPRPALGQTQPPNQNVKGALSLKVKRPGREADHSPVVNADIKNAWSYFSTPPYVFMSWYLVKYRDFTFS